MSTFDIKTGCWLYISINFEVFVKLYAVDNIMLFLGFMSDFRGRPGTTISTGFHKLLQSSGSSENKGE